MSLLLPDSEANVVTDKPRLHALVIGVADYPHLNNGTGPLANDPLGLGQITTPAFTAHRIVKWLKEEYNFTDKPLGSIELVLSPGEKIPNSAGAPVDVETATFLNIEAAFNRWVKRCSANKDNIAFFYFCGHGVQKDDQFLLPEDFGNPAIANQWRNCINFDATRVGMRACKAQTQVFFVDACRETPFGMLDQINVDGEALISAKVGDTAKCTATYYATTEGRQAFGPANGVSYFGEAVIECLNGLASQKAMGVWTVSTSSLSKSLVEVMSYYGDKYREILGCNPNVSDFGIIHKPGKAKVIARIRCSNDAATAAAEIEMRRNGVSHKAGLNDPKPLVREVEPGEWQFIINFPAGQFPIPQPFIDQLSPGVYEGVNVP